MVCPGWVIYTVSVSGARKIQRSRGVAGMGSYTELTTYKKVVYPVTV